MNSYIAMEEIVASMAGLIDSGVNASTSVQLLRSERHMAVLGQRVMLDNGYAGHRVCWTTKYCLPDRPDC